MLLNWYLHLHKTLIPAGGRFKISCVMIFCEKNVFNFLFILFCFLFLKKIFNLFIKATVLDLVLIIMKNIVYNVYNYLVECEMIISTQQCVK